MRRILSLLGLGRSREGTSAERAKALFGRWMLDLVEVEQQLGVEFPPREREKLAVVPWTEAVLESAAADCALFPGYAVTALELHAKGVWPFSSWPDARQLDWCRSKRFIAKAKVERRWYLIQRATRQAGAGTFADHRGRLGPEEELPRAVELVYMLALFSRARGESLFQDTAAHCADASDSGYHAGVGWGSIGSWADWATYPATNFRLQLAASRKPYR